MTKYSNDPIKAAEQRRREKERERQRYQTDPEYRERLKLAAREYHYRKQHDPEYAADKARRAREWYAANKESIQREHAASTLARETLGLSGKELAAYRLKEKRQYLWAVKAERGCIRCGEKDPVVLEFHHRDPAQKDYDAASLFRLSYVKIDAELAKCDVVCANCHRRIHHELRNGE